MARTSAPCATAWSRGTSTPCRPPYEIELTGTEALSAELRDLLQGFAELIEDGRAEGVPNVLRCKPPL
jgi:hypothetical protein